MCECYFINIIISITQVSFIVRNICDYRWKVTKDIDKKKPKTRENRMKMLIYGFVFPCVIFFLLINYVFYHELSKYVNYYVRWLIQYLQEKINSTICILILSTFGYFVIKTSRTHAEMLNKKDKHNLVREIQWTKIKQNYFMFFQKSFHFWFLIFNFKFYFRIKKIKVRIVINKKIHHCFYEH